MGGGNRDDEFDVRQHGLQIGRWHLLTPAQFIVWMFSRADHRIRRLAQFIALVLQWVGLPASILSFLVDRKWVVDTATWLYENAGQLQVVLLWIAQLATFVVAIWHSMIFPIRWLLESVFRVEIPNWTFDAGSIATLFVIGQIRVSSQMRLALGEWYEKHPDRIWKGPYEFRQITKWARAFIANARRSADRALVDVVRAKYTELSLTVDVATATYRRIVVERIATIFKWPASSDASMLLDEEDHADIEYYGFGLGIGLLYGKAMDKTRGVYLLCSLFCVALLLTDFVWFQYLAFLGSNAP